MTTPEVLADNNEVRGTVLGALHELYAGTEFCNVAEARVIVAERLDADIDYMNDALRQELAYWGLNIHNAKTEEADALHAEASKIVGQAVEMIEQYPWLIFKKGDQNLSAYTLHCMADNHVFDDYPLFFGLSQQEGHTVREALQNVRGEPRPDEDYYTAHYRAINETFGLDLPHRLD